MAIEIEAVGDGRGFYIKKDVPPDAIERPEHYTQGKIECIDFIEDQRMGYHEGCALKYIVRARFKGNEAEDLKKAIWYLRRRIEAIEAKKTGSSDAHCSI